MNEAMEKFTYNPVALDIPRSKMTMRHSHKTTFNTGRLIPIYWREVLPGSTVKMEMAEITRMQTPIFPIMDNAFIDTMFFFVPNRLLWEHWEEFMGENKTGFWEQPVDYEVPQIKFNTDNTLETTGAPPWIKGEKYYPYGVQAGSLADYLGIPIVDGNRTTPFWRDEFETNALPFRAYYQVFNDWWRDENLMYPLEFDKGDADVTAHIGDSDPEAEWCVTPPPQVAKFHDYFTSALPQPQKGDDVTISLGSNIPVIGNGMTLGLTNGTTNGGIFSIADSSATVRANEGIYGKDTGTTATGSGLTGGKSLGVTKDPEKSGLVADLSNFAGVTINDLRQSFAVQRYLEKLARSGSRYIEILHGLFGVISPDARLQRSEYLGGCRKAVNIDQVVQTSATDAVTPQGNTAAYSMTSQNEELFTKSFVEHGILLGVQVIRLEHSYQDGLNKMWLRKSKFDYYDPTFAHIGEMPIYNKELFVGTNKDDEAFGYQEAWAEYRYQNSRVSSEMRSKYHQTLDAWHFADNYSGLPSLDMIWIRENQIQMDRNIAVSQNLADQWLADIFFKETWTQPMPVYSIPGLIDHY